MAESYIRLESTTSIARLTLNRPDKRNALTREFIVEITEAVEAIGDFAFQQLGARRVEIRTDTRNSQSRKIPERLGYDLEGILRHDRLDTQGLPRNTAVYAKTR